MKTVTLSGRVARGRVARVDDADYELVSRYRWHVLEQDRGPGRRPGGPYARAGIYRPSDQRTVMILMHVLITGRIGTDHANGNGLDNQRENLRPAGQPLNTANMRPYAVSTSSQFKGVRRHREGKWEARIRVGRPIYLGLFSDEEDAARAYDAAAIAAWGEFARVNFP